MKRRLEHVALISGMTLASINLWTGVPLLALWLGSRATGGASISMAALLVVVVTMVAGSLAVVRALAWMDGRQRRLTGRKRGVRRHTPWLRSMSERPHDRALAQSQLAALDYVLVAVVVAGVIAFEVWFFFFSASPLDQRSGRD